MQHVSSKLGNSRRWWGKLKQRFCNLEWDISITNVTEPEYDGKIRVKSTFKSDESMVNAVEKVKYSQVSSLKKQALCKNQNGAVRCNRKKKQNMRNVAPS